MRRYPLCVVSALCVGALVSWGAAGCSRATKPSAAADYGRTPVLCVHGLGLSSDSWKALRDHLITVGYPPEYLRAVDIVPGGMANDQAAETVLQPAVESLLSRASAAAQAVGIVPVPERVDIVAHSMGAVSSRFYAARIRPERVRTWVAIAGANHGSEALCSLADEASAEMCRAYAESVTESAVQVALNGTPSAPIDETPYGMGRDRASVASVPPDGQRRILYYTSRIDPDRWVQPAQSAVIDGAGGVDFTVPAGVNAIETSPGNFLMSGLDDHDGMPGHHEVIRLVFEMLTVLDGSS